MSIPPRDDAMPMLKYRADYAIKPRSSILFAAGDFLGRLMRDARDCARCFIAIK